MESVRQLESYYYFQDSLGNVMQVLDKPSQWINAEIDTLNYSHAATAQKVAAFIKVIFISIPLLPCYLIARLVYFAAGEKISTRAFQEAAKNWQEVLIMPLYDKSSEIFINHLIASKVSLEDCSYKNIAIFSPKQQLAGEPLSMYEPDSPIFSNNPRDFVWIKKEGRILAIAHTTNPLGNQIFKTLCDSLKGLNAGARCTNSTQKKLVSLTDMTSCNLWDPRDCVRAIKKSERSVE